MEKPRILIADDDLDDLTLISEAFMNLGYGGHVKVMQGGRPIIDYLSSSGADDVKLIILDMNMPILSGIDILRILKNDARYRGIPVVIFSTSVSEQDRKTCRDLGANEFVTKPIKYFDYIEICKNFYAASQNVKI